jgi:type I restriction enzyme S subunit
MPAITTDNSHYEIRDGVEVCIDEELPFDIPDSWVWVHLESVCEYIQRGKSPKILAHQKIPRCGAKMQSVERV